MAAISSSPFAANDQVTPWLTFTRTNGTLTLNLPTVSATTAGFLAGRLVCDLQSRTSLTLGNWQGVAGYTNLAGDGSRKCFTNFPSAPASSCSKGPGGVWLRYCQHVGPVLLPC